MHRTVLVVAEYGWLNGAEHSFLSVAAELKSRKWEFQVATPGGTEFADALADLGIQTVDFCFDAPATGRKSQAEIRREFDELCRRHRPQLVHCNSLSASRLIAPVTASRDIPSLGYLRDIVKLSKKAVADLNQLDRMVAVSHATRRWHLDQGIRAQKTFVVHNGINLSQFRPAESGGKLHRELRCSESDRLLLFVGQLGMRKGSDVLIDVFINIADRLSDVRLAIVGDRHSQKQEAIEFAERIRKTAAESRFEDRIHWLGRRADVADCMNAATLLIHPARQEPLGRVLLEAAACGLPIVATDVGGTPEILAGLEDLDLICRPDDKNQLFQRVFGLLNDARRLAQASSRLRSMAERRFNVTDTADKLETHYMDLISNRPQGPA